MLVHFIIEIILKCKKQLKYIFKTMIQMNTDNKTLKISVHQNLVQIKFKMKCMKQLKYI